MGSVRCFLLLCGCLALSATRPALAAIERYTVLGKTLKQLRQSKGPGAYASAYGSKSAHVDYREHWPGLSSAVTARYFLSSDAVPRVERIRLDFPTGASRRGFRTALESRMGLPPDRMKTQRGRLFADWIWQGVHRRLSDSSGRIEINLTLAHYTLTGVGNSAEAIILQDAGGYVTGKRTKDTVYLVGIPFDAGAIWMKSLFLVTRSARRADGPDRPYALGCGGMVDSEIRVQDFTGDGRPEILVSAPTGGSGGLSEYALVSLRGGMRPLVDARYLSGGPPITVKFEDAFAAKVSCRSLHRRWTLNLRNYRNDYIRAGVYDIGGRLLKPATGAVDGVARMSVRGTGGRPTLVAYRKIWGTYHANSIGQVVTRWRWSRGKLRIIGMDIHDWPK